MGIYGNGNAFNLSFTRQRPMFYGLQSRRMAPPPPMGGFSQTTNVTVKNGIGGFWGFMGGLMSGLTGNSIFGGMNSFGMGGFGGLFGMGGMSPFGMGMGMPMFGGFNTGLGSGVFGMLNGAQMGGAGQAQNSEASNLQQVFSKYKVLTNSDGTYSLTKGDATIFKSGTYEELLNFAKEAGEKEGIKTGDDDKITKDNAASKGYTIIENGDNKDKYTDKAGIVCELKDGKMTPIDNQPEAGNAKAKMDQAKSHNPQIERKDNKWIDNNGKEYTWDDTSKDFKEAST